MYSRTKLPESLPAETVREPWRQVLLDAAGFVRKRGLAKFTQEDDEGRVCVHGAINLATIGLAEYRWPNDCRATLALARYLRAQGVPEDLAPDGGCAMWNNAPGTTQEMVITALEGAARSALREGG